MIRGGYKMRSHTSTTGFSASYMQCIRELAAEDPGEGGLGSEDAKRLFGAMLDGGVPELELGGLLVALSMKPLPLSVLLGFGDALAEHVMELHAPVGGRRPIVMPAYGGALRQPNLTPLLAMVLQRLGIPVLIHGTLEGHGRIATAYVLRELGVLPCTTLAQVQVALDRDNLAFAPTGVLAPGLAQLLALRRRIGLDGAGLLLARLIDPFRGAGLRMVSSDRAEELDLLRALLLASGDSALLMTGTEGEVFVNPRRRPCIELIAEGAATRLFGEENLHEDQVVQELPVSELDPRATAALVRDMLDGTAKLPLPLVNQLACCLFGCGYTSDFNQAKAIIAVESRSMAAA